ncbi:Laccase-4 [Armadillidium nasatum]|uniref:Laccase-4 n=1 Tax=Armadillidium nasatum TaxID=96803 RepID=A0A5N5SY17_9CRUS|nr:Laccase-4 [Armadillidium nasatum]
MDGVPLLNHIECTSFRYHFIADPPGTHYWHSHSGFQRADGMFGSLIVRSRNDSHKNLYDFDDNEHVIFITDWSDKLLIDKFLNHHHTLHENLPAIDNLDSLVIYGGERWDFVIVANQKPGVYWFKFRGLLACDENFLSVYQIAVLRYEGHNGFPSKPQDVNYAFTYRNGLQLNTLNEAPGDRTTFYSAADIRNQDHFEDVSAYAREPDYKIWLESEFYPRDDDWVHNKDFYPFFGESENLKL